VRTVRVLIVHRHRLFAQAISRRIDTEPGIRMVGTAATAAAAETAVDALGPDVALVVGLCAEEACPVVPSAQSEHWPLRDPAGSTDLNVYRELRDELRRRIDGLIARLEERAPDPESPTPEN